MVNFVEAVNRFLRRSHRLIMTVGLLTVLTFGWVNVLSINMPAAIAASNNPLRSLVDNAKEALNQGAGSGTSTQLEGQIDRATGSLQRHFGKATGQIEGGAKQLEGKVKQDIGSTQRNLDKASRRVESTARQAQGQVNRQADEIKDAIKDARSNVDETSNTVVDAVKDFFGQ